MPVADSGIPHDLIDKARQQLERRYRPRPKAQNTFELGGMLTCSECGCGITAFTGGHNKAGEPYRYYVCNKRKRHTALCPNGPSWRAERLEKIVARRVERLLQDPEQIKVRIDRAISG